MTVATTAPRKTAHKEDRHFVTALARGLDVLACFRGNSTMLTNQEIAQRCNLPRSTVSRLTMTLTKLGYLVHLEDSGRYQLGMACLALGSSMLARMDIRKFARPLMQELADFSGGTVSLGVRDRLAILYVESCRSPAALALTLDVGSRIPLATSAIGRAWLSQVPERERQDVMEEIRALDDVAWPQIRRGLEQGMADYARIGVTCSFGDWQKEVFGIACAFDPGGGRPVMAINVGGPSSSLSEAFLLEEVRPRLLALVARLQNLVAEH